MLYVMSRKTYLIKVSNKSFYKSAKNSYYPIKKGYKTIINIKNLY